MTVCLRYMKDHSAAEDILIRAFARVFEKLSSFQQKGSLEGWIRRIVVNEALGRIRTESSMKWEVSLEDGLMDAASSENVLDTISAKELLDLIQTLPIGYRTVFNLYAIEGYSHKEIAEELGIREGTSKSQFNRARLTLQKKIESLTKISEYGS